MNKQQIIDTIASNSHYRSICKKIAKGTGLHEDLYQEFFVVLCGYAPEKLEGIYSRGEIKWFCVSLLYQMFFYKTAPFHRKFRNHNNMPIDTAFDDTINLEEEHVDAVFISDNGYDFETDILLDRIEQKINKDLTSSEDSSVWYSAKIFSLYMQEGSSRKLSKKVQIPYRSIAHTVQQYKQDLRMLINDEAA